MGHIEVTRRWVAERRLVLDDGDLVKQKQRRERRQEVALLQWHKSFSKRLEKCPYCGKVPYLSASWFQNQYSYKYICECYHKGMLDCGDWYAQLSRAGLDWNYRVRMEKGMSYRHCPHWKGKNK